MPGRRCPCWPAKMEQRYESYEKLPGPRRDCTRHGRDCIGAVAPIRGGKASLLWSNQSCDVGEESEGEASRPESAQSVGPGARADPVLGAGVSTLYDGNGKIFTVAEGKKKVPFAVTIPPPAGGTGGATPTGIVFNSVTADFGGDLFIFSTEDGTISGWQQSDGTGAVLHVDNSQLPSRPLINT
jgi:hypothetical protein